ncbi:hypothetical protein HN873_062557 [Arachis hypogaea]
MKENSESALSTSKEAISNATRNLMESSILDQDERWRHALHMQVGREVVFPVADGYRGTRNGEPLFPPDSLVLRMLVLRMSNCPSPTLTAQLESG